MLSSSLINCKTLGMIGVDFMVWGQEATTVFHEHSELQPLVWCKRLIERNLGRPIRVYLWGIGTDIVTQPQMELLIQQWIEET